jgi:hypothetical protein
MMYFDFVTGSKMLALAFREGSPRRGTTAASPGPARRAPPQRSTRRGSPFAWWTTSRMSLS